MTTTTTATLPAIRRLGTLDESHVRGLAQVLCDCVAGGASVSFMQPLSLERAEGFWRGVAAGVARGERALLVAEDADGAIVGTVQLVLAQPENQPHRADVAKMLVHRRARRLGLAAALMRAVEREAALEAKSLLVLDTVTGGDAERLYERLGWQRCGVIPDYALWPGGGLCATTVFFKALAPA
jgi:GNAT superfamily N-acetyltransferase